MSILLRVRDYFRPYRKKHRIDPRRVRAIPGAIPQSPLEWRVHSILAVHATCPWDHLVADVAEYLRRSFRPGVLAVMDEGFWGGWVWPALATEELQRLEGNLIETETLTSHAADRPASTLRPTSSCEVLARLQSIVP
jgi:hypothetical protein